ncbi:MAG: hypothetical protein P4L35_17425, partial [Ignavibacteriaceae bacterium]|nr:hypothetical protein [Ignavibacteriaceae bacterium]
MKLLVYSIVSLLFLTLSVTRAQFDDLINKAKNKAVEEMQKKDKDKEQSANNEKKQESNNVNTSNSKTSQPPDTKTYQNYDFIPGDIILFEDNFSDDQSGEFPSHWDLLSGQAQVSTFQGEK